jgi:hypothetical protein|tara:strand:- start:497 stop:1111 length:615 start_codon:yes stop_codon:yes gene_type:complete
MKQKKNTSQYVFQNIPNTEEGEQFVKTLRGFLNKDRYQIVKKFQHAIPGAYKGKPRMDPLPKEFAQHIRLYVTDKVGNAQRHENFARDLSQRDQINSLQIKVNELENELIKLQPVKVPEFQGDCLCSVNRWIKEMNHAGLLFHFANPIEYFENIDDDVSDIEWNRNINSEQVRYIAEVQKIILAICERENISVFQFYPDLAGAN